MVLAPTPLGKGSTRAWGLMPSSSVGFDAFRETHKQKDSTAFQVKSRYALSDKAESRLTRRDKGLRAILASRLNHAQINKTYWTCKSLIPKGRNALSTNVSMMPLCLERST